MTRSAYSAITLFVFDVAVAVGSVFLAKYLQRILPGVSLPDELLWLKAGIYAIWNFTHVKLNVPAGIIVLHENLASSLVVLSKKLALAMGTETDTVR